MWGCPQPSDTGSIAINFHSVQHVVDSDLSASLGWIFRVVGDIVNSRLFPVFFRTFLRTAVHLVNA